MHKKIYQALLLLSISMISRADGPTKLPAIDTSSPRATLTTFMNAMNDYRKGVETDDKWLLGRLNDAVYCLDMGAIPENRREFYSNSGAIYLKEVIDRIMLVDLQKVPADASQERWRLAQSVVTINRCQSGERRGEYLFSSESVKRAQELYKRIRHLPYLEGSGKGTLLEEQTKKSEKTKGLYVKTGNPRQTMRTFMEAMNDYKKGVESNDAKLQSRINDATSCLHLGQISSLVKEEEGKRAAILLKEVIDRIIAIDLSLIPERETNGDPVVRWQLARSNNRIIIVRVLEGERKGEHLFSPGTVKGIYEFYKEVKKDPYQVGTGMGAGYTTPWLEKAIPDGLRHTIILFPNWQWLGLFLAILLGYVARAITRHVLGVLKKVASRSKTEWDDRLIEAVDSPMGLVGASMFWYFAVHALRFEGPSQVALLLTVKALFGVACIWTLYKLVDVLTGYLTEKADQTENDFDDQLIPLIKRALRTFIVVFGVLITIQTLGFNVMSLLAGLGLGGLAFALAARDTCANLFGSIMILSDRPFHIGEWVKVGSLEGTVEEIGFRSTRIRTFYDSLVTIPNSALANSNIDNLGRRKYRRTVAKLGLTYDTPAEKVEAFTEGVKNIMKANPNVRKDYFIVSFNEYADFSLNILLYFFFKVNSYSEEMMERHNVYLEILRLAEEIGVSFAFPTQSIYLENMPESGYQPQSGEFTREGLQAKVSSFGPNGELSRPSGSGIYTPPHLDPDLQK